MRYNLFEYGKKPLYFLRSDARNTKEKAVLDQKREDTKPYKYLLTGLYNFVKMHVMTETFYNLCNNKGNFLRRISLQAIKTMAKGEFLKCVSCIVIQGDKIIFELRTDQKSGKGSLDFCSGKIDNDEKPNEAMIRELGEELGIEKQIAENITELGNHPITLNAGYIKNAFVTLYYLNIPENQKLKIQEAEIKKAIKLPFADAFKLIRGDERFRVSYNADMEKSLTKLVNHLYMDELLNAAQANLLLQSKLHHRENLPANSQTVH